MTAIAIEFPVGLASLLRCPVDGSPLRIEVVAGGQALLVGDVVDYPVLCGIPRLMDDPLRRQLVALLRAGHHDAAERLVLRWPTFALGPRLRRRVARELGAMMPEAIWLSLLLSRFADGGAIREPHASFTELVRRHSTGLYPDWFAYRFGARTFLPIVGLTGLLPVGQPVLEIGTGCGHSAFVLGRHTVPENVLAIDHQFAQLYAAKRFIAPAAHYVCADVERGLPLAAASFSAVVMNDTFHFVHAKQQLADEIDRVTEPDATLILSQIHNGLFPETFAGEPLQPAEYAAMFSAWAPRIIRNDRLIQSLSKTGGFDLADPELSADLKCERSLSLIGRRGEAGPMSVRDLWRSISERRSQLIFNPVLERIGDGLAPRTDIHPVVADIISMPDLEGLEGNICDPAEWSEGAVIELLRRRVLLDVPSRFV